MIINHAAVTLVLACAYYLRSYFFLLVPKIYSYVSLSIQSVNVNAIFFFSVSASTPVRPYNNELSPVKSNGSIVSGGAGGGRPSVDSLLDELSTALPNG